MKADTLATRQRRHALALADTYINGNLSEVKAALLAERSPLDAAALAMHVAELLRAQNQQDYLSFSALICKWGNR